MTDIDSTPVLVLPVFCMTCGTPFGERAWIAVNEGRVVEDEGQNECCTVELTRYTQ